MGIPHLHVAVVAVHTGKGTASVVGLKSDKKKRSLCNLYAHGHNGNLPMD
jgi:hypothetical protein